MDTDNRNGRVRDAVMSRDIDEIKKDIAYIKGQLDVKYVTQTEFGPIRSLVYGMVGLVMTSVVVALIALVLK